MSELPLLFLHSARLASYFWDFLTLFPYFYLDILLSYWCRPNNGALKKAMSESLKPRNVTIWQKKGLCEVIKDFEMRLSRVLQVGPLTSIFIRERQGKITQIEEEKDIWLQRGRVWSDVATSQRMPVATRSWKKQGTNSPLKLPEGAWLCQHLGLGQEILIWNFWLPKLWENKFMLF